jgi:hypothetical protein
MGGTSQHDTTAAVLDSEPPWLPPDSYPIEWEPFARYPNYLAAQIVAGLFQNEGLPAIVTVWTAFPGIASAVIWVPNVSDAPRAMDRGTCTAQ